MRCAASVAGRAGDALILLAVTFAALAGCATNREGMADAAVLSAAMASRPVVLLGEVHDNLAQHALRLEALRRLVARGVRPALAFEQFDRDRSELLNSARTEPLPENRTRAEHLIARAGTGAWDWRLYRPYLELALAHELPIVAANLSREEAMRIVRGQQRSNVDSDAASTVRVAHEIAVEQAHCGMIPKAMLAGMAEAQMARDVALAEAIRPYFARGVILLTGNGHARNDIGVPFWLTQDERLSVVTIGLVEDDDVQSQRVLYDVVLTTKAQGRDDPCAALRQPQR